VTFRRVLSVLLALGISLAVGLLTYGFRVRASANALIDSARRIRSTADAQREIALWRNRSDRDFSESDATGGDHNYDIHVENGLLGRLGIARPGMLGVTIAFRNGELRYITAVMIGGRTPSLTSGVWIQEWFDSSSPKNFRLGRQDEPRKAIVEFSSALPESEKERIFRLNTKCLVRLGGCKSAEDMLPGVWQFRGPSTGG
jgi:hypothetical protein